MQIADFKKEVGISRTIALTATATKAVKEDIISKLELKDCQTFQKSFARANLSYSVFKLESKQQKLVEILENVHGSSVVYVRSRKRTKEISDFLNRNGISSTFYHAGLSGKERDERQAAWIGNQTRVVVATNAFGMGIDKPDVRTVVHMDLPDTLEAYYQEAGRAGRDEKKAYAVALYHNQDTTELKDRAERSVVSKEDLKRTYQALANFYKLAIGSQSFSSFEFDFEQFTTTYNLSSVTTFSAMKKLSDEGLIQLTDGFYEQSRMSFILEKPEIYTYQVANPKLDPILKSLMRLYGGELFANYLPIKEKEIASLLKTDVRQVKKWLQFLHDQKVIDYQTSSDSQRITFLTPRQDVENLPIDNKQIEWRRNLAMEKAQAVVDYMTTDQCRTNVFQRYFDEEPEATCGICDIDLSRRAQKDLTTEQVKNILVAKSSSFSELKTEFISYSEEQILAQLRILLEDGYIIENNGVYSLK